MQAKCSLADVEQQTLYWQIKAWLYDLLDLKYVGAHEEAKPSEHVHTD